MKKKTIFKPVLATAFLLTVMMVALVFGIKTEAAYSPTVTITVNNGKVTSNSPQYGKNPWAVQVLTDVSGLTKGNIYYFDKNGNLSDLGNGSTITAYFFTGVGTSNSPVKALTKANGAIKLLTGSYNNKAYYNGDLFNGLWFEGGKYYTCTSGARGALRSGILTGTYYNAGTRTFGNLGKGVNVVNGVPTTAVINLRLYLYGIFNETYTGWNKIGNNVYYFNNGLAVTGWKTLPSYGRWDNNQKKYINKSKKSIPVNKYSYLFKANGVLETNLVWNYYTYQNFLSQKIKIIVNKKTHNTTFYVWDGKSYSIPALTVVCATARKKNDTPSGTFRLEKTWNKRWYVYTKTKGAPYRYYQWAVKIHGTASLFHSSTYRKKSAKTLRVDLYNKIGTSCTTHCVRHQARYAKLIYDIARYKIKVKKWRKTRIPVQIMTSENEGPFGHVGHSKVANGTKWDPTDPNRK